MGQKQTFSDHLPNVCFRGNVLGYFSPQNRWVFLYFRDEDATSGISNLNVLAHETTHQLQWHFSKDPKNPKYRNFEGEAPSAWFQEGWAEFVGGSCRKVPDSEDFQFEWYALGRLEGIRLMKKRRVPLMPIKYLVERESYNEFRRWVRDVWLPEARDMTPEASHKWLTPPMYFSAMYSQSYYFVYFLNNYENGKYKQKFRDFIMTILRGKNKPPNHQKRGKSKRWESVHDAFIEIFFGWDDPYKDLAGLEKEWARMQKEHDEMLDPVLKDAPKPPKKKEDDEEKDEDEESSISGIDDDEEEEEEGK